MLQWIKSLFQPPPRPAGPARVVKKFTPADATITKQALAPEGDGWLADTEETLTIRLFDIDNPQVENCMLTYRADLKTEDVKQRSYLEMWCRIPGRGEFFSKGLHNALQGTNDWSSYEIPFYLKKGQQPDQIKLNLTVEGGGKVWIKDIELLSTPLSSA